MGMYKAMRLSLRFVIPLLIAVGIFAYGALPLADRLMLRWFSRDLETRANLIATTIQDPLQDLIRTGDRRHIEEFFTRITQDERLLAVALCPPENGEPVATTTLPKEVRCSDLDRFTEPGDLLQTAGGPVFVSVRPMVASATLKGLPIGQLVLVHDMSFIARRSRETREYLFLFFVGLGLMVALVTVIIAQLSWRGWIQGLRGLLRGETLFLAPGRAGPFPPPPPDDPQYQLRRVWLSPGEEAGYYYGFANEGIWPLCHIAHVRPIFRTSDWEQYVNVNRKFASTVEQESNSPNPIVLVQDYHLALLPRMIREALPAATIISFWHIPWPNPEAFAICPWRDELLDGLLDSTILGFHTQFHVNNFVDTVDRFLEARVDRETFSVSYRGKPTSVKRYPISVEWPPPAELLSKPVEQCRTVIRQRHNLPPEHAVGIGVDRMDYTKGIEVRMRAVERLLAL